jgi:hypothetical protein
MGQGRAVGLRQATCIDIVQLTPAGPADFFEEEEVFGPLFETLQSN